MKGIGDKILGYIARCAKKATYDSMGFASRTYGYEPKIPESVKAYKANHTSKVETIFDKIIK